MLNNHTNIVNFFQCETQAISYPVDDADLLEINIVVKEGDKTVHQLPSPQPFYTQGGFNIDFSTGLILTNLKDYSFIFKDVPNIEETGKQTDTTLNKKVLKNDNGKLEVGLGVLAHARSRISSHFNLGLSLGFLLPSSDPSSVRYLGGVSTMLGQKRRLVFSGGFAIGKIDRLGTGLSLNTIIINPGVSEVPTRKSWETGWYFGILLNL